MQSRYDWSVGINPWGRLDIRLHIAFFLFAMWTIHIAWLRAATGEQNASLQLTVGGLLVLLASVLVHELAHWRTARWLGESPESLVLFPFGGLTPTGHQQHPRAQLMILLSGPLVNATLAVVTSGLLCWNNSSDAIISLLHPLTPTQLLDEPQLWLRFVKLVFWVTWILTLVNLLPVLPFDGGRMLEVAIGVLRQDMRLQDSVTAVVQLSKSSAWGMLLLSFVLWLDFDASAYWLMPSCLALAALAVFVYFSARHEQRREDELADEGCGEELLSKYRMSISSCDALVKFLEQESTLELNGQSPGPVEFEQDREAQEEQEMDEILVRLHRDGFESLSSQDHAALQRASARMRRRYAPDD